MTDRAILGREIVAFEGVTLPRSITVRVREAPAAGMTLFRHSNVRTPGQVLELTEAFQRAAGRDGEAASAGDAGPAGEAGPAGDAGRNGSASSWPGPLLV